MRRAPVTFASLDEALSKSPRFVVAILYDVDSIYVTSHAGIANVPGLVIEGALAEPSIASQRLRPDEAAAEIGSASFSLVDLGRSFTAAVRARLGDGSGLRGRQVRFYLGYESLGFEDFQLVGTQTVSGVSYADGRYTLQCLDIQRALRTDIFELQTTTLAASVAPTDTTITLTSTAGLRRVQHGPSYTDAPNALVGYLKVKNEIIRYSGFDGNQITGCARGVFGTVPGTYTVDPATPADRRERVSEYVYLELPAIKLAYALLTGVIHGSLDRLPPKWHLGVNPELIVLNDFVGIGNDLWNPIDDNAGFIVRFEGLAKSDGKRFLEKEIFLLTGVYSPVGADGRLGLRRAVRLHADAATILTLDDSNSVQTGALTHDMQAVYNAFVVDWSWNGEEFRRSTAYVDAVSRAKHGHAETFRLAFKGLYGARHTDGIIFQLLDMLRDRYAGPPLRLTVDVLHSLNRIEIGDVVRGRWSNIRDFTGATSSIDRAFEVQSVSVNHQTGKVTVELFASTAEASEIPPTRAVVSLPDAHYTSEGTNLSAAPGVVVAGGVLTSASQPLSGSTNLNASSAVYFYDGDLTIAAGVELRLAHNVQLRVRGFLQINGAIVGRGGGHAGVVDDGRALIYPDALDGEGPVPADAIPGNRGYVGNVRGYDGVRTHFTLLGLYALGTWPPALTVGLYAVAPRLLLQVRNNSLLGLPTDLRGSGGAPGGRIGNANAPYPVEGRGGAGASGGAGLVITCRGMAFGSNGYVDLSGNSSVATAAAASGNLVRYPGAGAPGGPGTMYVLLDGANLSVPDLSGNKFRSRAGTAPVSDANALISQRLNGYVSRGRYSGSAPQVFSPVRGFEDAEFAQGNGKDYSGSTVVVQYVPSDEVVVDDPPKGPPRSLDLWTESVEQGIQVYITLPPDLSEVESVQLFASVDGNRTNATKVAEGLFDSFRLRVPDGASRRFWTRNRNTDGFSRWLPESATAGVLGAALGGLIARNGAEAFGTVARKPVTVAPGWNADVYSVETYVGGCYVSFQAGALGHSLMVGLNADPDSSPGYTSLDHAWYVVADGHAEIYENGVHVASFGAYTTDTVFSIKYDGQTVRYFKDGVLVRSIQRSGASFFVDSSFDTPGGWIKSLKYGPLTTAPTVPWVARGNCVVTAREIAKQGGIVAWDSDAYSFEAYRLGAFVSFQPDQTNAELMAGFNSDPLTDSAYQSLDFAWYLGGDGICYFYESGSSPGNAGPYTKQTVLAIAYDGRVVRYLRDGVLVREVYAPDRTFHFDSSFRHPGASIRSVTFTPYGSATPVPFLSRSPHIVVSDSGAQKLSTGPVTWENDFISINGYSNCFVEFKASPTAEVIVGLNSDPYTTQHYDSIDASWNAAANGTAYIYEGATFTGVSRTYSESSTFAITYNGTTISWILNGAVVRTASMPGRTMFVDGTIYTPGASVNSLRFGPGTTLTQLDTAQLRPRAITYTAQSYAAGPVAMSANAVVYPTQVHEFSPPPQEVDCVLDVTATYENWHGSINGNQYTVLGVRMGDEYFNASPTPYVVGDSQHPDAQTIAWQFPYTARAPVSVRLYWITDGWPAGATYRNVTFVTKFVKR